MGNKAKPKLIYSTAPNQIDRIKENLISLDQKAIADVVKYKIEDVLAGRTSVIDYTEELTKIQIDAEEQTRIESNKHQARFPFFRTLKAYDFTRPKEINKEQIMYLATCDFIAEGTNVLIFGPARVGKTHIAIGLGYEAICQGHPTLFVDLTDLLVKLSRRKMSRDQEETELHKLQNKKLIILDEIREQEIDPNARTFLFRLIKYRNEQRKPIIFTSMQGLEQWRTIFSTDRDSVIGRIRDRAIEVVIKGDPYTVRAA